MQDNCCEKFITVQIEMVVAYFGVITKPVHTSRRRGDSTNRQSFQVEIRTRTG